ncbi:MAG TPA: hypothetical protein VN654_05275 [Vicinamibacterales bacterium]|nr:hypothetical protein [Vicinamibacterales bacterium]
MTKAQLGAVIRGLVPAIHDYIAACQKPMHDRLTALETQDRLAGEPGPAGLPGKDGADGFGFDDLTVLHDGERGVTFRFLKGDRVKEFTVTIPAVIYRGVYTTGKTYEQGDTVTWDGSMWHCNGATMARPGDGSTAWQMTVRRPRDGRDGKDAPTIPVVSVGRTS